MTAPKKPVEIRYELAAFCDGSCRGNGTANSSTSCAVRYTNIANGDTGEFSTHLGPGTNNSAELEAVRHALLQIEKYCKAKKYPIFATRVTIYTDSEYVIGSCEGRYRVRHNQALIAHLKSRAKMFGEVRYEKVSAHSGNIGNDLVDRLAKKAHPERKVKVFMTHNHQVAESSDIFDLIEKSASEAYKSSNAHTAFALKKGKSYRVSFKVTEVTFGEE